MASPRDTQTVGKLQIQGIFPSVGIRKGDNAIRVEIVIVEAFGCSTRKENERFRSKDILNENRFYLCWNKMRLGRAAGQIFLIFLILVMSGGGV